MQSTGEWWWIFEDWARNLSVQFLIKSKRLRLSESSSVPSSIILSSDEHADVYARSPHLVDVWNDWEKIWSDFSDLSKSSARGPLLERSWSSLPIFSQNLQYFHWIEFIGKLAKLVKNIPAVSPDRIGTKIDSQINRPYSGLDSRGVLRAGLLGEVHQLVGILTDEPLLVVAGDVVPHLTTFTFTLTLIVHVASWILNCINRHRP